VAEAVVMVVGEVVVAAGEDVQVAGIVIWVILAA
jgi:hypothetical protein